MFKDGPDIKRCHDFASDIVSRGLYAAQISQWFQHIDPKQFLFLSTDDLFEDPLKELNKVANFVGLKVPFSREMIESRVEGVRNEWKYRSNGTLVEEAKQILRDFYRTPNEELYELLKLHGHHIRNFNLGASPSSKASFGGIELNDMIM